MKIQIVEKTREVELPELLVYTAHIVCTIQNEETREAWYRIYEDEANIYSRGLAGEDMIIWREEPISIEEEGFEISTHSYNPLLEGADSQDLMVFVQEVYQNHFDGKSEMPYCDSRLAPWVWNKLQNHLPSKA